MSLRFEQSKGGDFFFVFKHHPHGTIDAATIRDGSLYPYEGESFTNDELFTIAHFITEQTNGGEPQGCRK